MDTVEKVRPLDDLLAGTSKFRPFAYYDIALDAIRVQIMDCSLYEDRLNQFVTLYYANSGINSNPVGFAIKGVGHLFATLNLKTEGVILISKILDSLVKELPAYGTKVVLETFNAWPQRDKPTEVNFSLNKAA